MLGFNPSLTLRLEIPEIQPTLVHVVYESQESGGKRGGNVCFLIKPVLGKNLLVLV